MSKIVGIDLGTSTSEIACIVDGKPFIIPNDLGKAVTPSVVHIPVQGPPLVGETALGYLFTQPQCTFLEVKRLTGSEEILRAHGKTYRPEDIQAMILRYLADCAAQFLHETIEGAVITVPAYFTDVQRRATARAGELAGIRVERIINEPTAAALDFGLANLEACKNILIYDLGGGTLDVTVLELFEGVIDVKASGGNNRLGGKDFDEAVMERLRLEFLAEHERDLSKDARAMMRLKKAAEDCKIALSNLMEHRVELPFLIPGAKGKPLSIERTVRREELEEWIGGLAGFTRAPMLSTLADARLKQEELDIVLLVGGSTKIPFIANLVRESLGNEPQALVDPDLAVVRGAAIQAGILEGSLKDEQEIVLTDVCPYTLGTAVLQSGIFGDQIVFDPLIPRNTTIPVEKTKIYYPSKDYQTEVIIKAYQGESNNPEHNEYLGEVRLTSIPPAPQGKETIAVAFAYDMNGILQVAGKVVSTGKQVATEIATAGVEPRQPLNLEQWIEAKDAKKYRPAVRKAEKHIKNGHFLTDDLLLSVNRLKEALLLEDEQEISVCYDMLRELLEEAE